MANIKEAERHLANGLAQQVEILKSVSDPV